jgi:hypothetical protein
MKKTRIALTTLAPFALAGAALGLRAALAPAESPPPAVDLSPAARERLAARARASEVGAGRLRAELSRLEVLLVGEEHFYRETALFLCDLLGAVEGRRVSLLLELPRGMQPLVDEWVRTGASAGLASAMREGDALPLGDVLAWAHRNPGRVSRVTAMDEDPSRIFVNRALLRDTRNETMADAILAERRRRPSDLVVAYGGQMHMLLGGRYRYDQEDRTPAGARLLRRGVPRDKLRSVMLSGPGKSHVADAWPGPGVLMMSADIGAEPWAYFIDDPIFGAASGRDLFDEFVLLGDLTRVAR